MEAATNFRLLNDFQRHFPLTARPFATIGHQLGLSEADVRFRLAVLLGERKISRIGAVFSPGRIGCSTLAAMAVPPEDLTRVAEILNGFPEINHNYEREHRFNLWFVVTASDASHLSRSLQAIETAAGLPLLRLPLLEAFHIDLGFPIDRPDDRHFLPPPETTDPIVLSDAQRRLVGVLQAGLPLHPTPYREMAARCGYTVAALTNQLADWQESGTIKRFGIIVRHHELGFGANAMVVHDIPDDQVAVVGQSLAREPGITLCYRRPRALPTWRYNLFCMVHGRQRDAVEAQIKAIRERHGLMAVDHAVLFSARRFKQEGARYA